MDQHNNTPELQNKGNNSGVNPQFNLDKIVSDAKVLLAGNGVTDNEITGEKLLLAKITEIPCLVEPFLQQTGLACLAGSSDTGKSSLLRQLAIDITTGQISFLDFIIKPIHRSAIYVSTEDAERETSYLLTRQAGEYLPELLKGLRFLFDTSSILKELDSMLTNKAADLVIIDCFADVYGGDLKDTQKIRTYLHPFHELAQKHQCLILFLHHTGKRTENMEPSKNNLLSGQGFEAKMRLVMELRADLINPNHRHLCIVKGNYLPSSLKKESYVLCFDEQIFLFRNTGERMPFELLAKQNEDSGKAKYLKAKELKDAGKTLDEIANIMGYANRGGISKILTNGEKKGWN